MEDWKYKVLAAVRLQGDKLAEAALDCLRDFDARFDGILTEGMSKQTYRRLEDVLSEELQQVMTGAKK